MGSNSVVFIFFLPPYSNVSALKPKKLLPEEQILLLRVEPIYKELRGLGQQQASKILSPFEKNIGVYTYTLSN